MSRWRPPARPLERLDAAVAALGAYTRGRPRRRRRCRRRSTSRARRSGRRSTTTSTSRLRWPRSSTWCATSTGGSSAAHCRPRTPAARSRPCATSTGSWRSCPTRPTTWNPRSRPCSTSVPRREPPATSRPPTDCATSSRRTGVTVEDTRDGQRWRRQRRGWTWLIDRVPTTPARVRARPPRAARHPGRFGPEARRCRSGGQRSRAASPRARPAARRQGSTGRTDPAAAAGSIDRPIPDGPAPDPRPGRGTRGPGSVATVAASDRRASGPASRAVEALRGPGWTARSTHRPAPCGPPVRRAARGPHPRPGSAAIHGWWPSAPLVRAIGSPRGPRPPYRDGPPRDRGGPPPYRGGPPSVADRRTGRPGPPPYRSGPPPGRPPPYRRPLGIAASRPDRPPWRTATARPVRPAGRSWQPPGPGPTPWPGRGARSRHQTCSVPTRSSSPAAARSRRSSPPAGPALRLLVVPQRRQRPRTARPARHAAAHPDRRGRRRDADRHRRLRWPPGRRARRRTARVRHRSTTSSPGPRSAASRRSSSSSIRSRTRRTSGPCCAAPRQPGVQACVFPTRRQAPLSPAAVKASAGAVEHLLLCPVDDLPGALADLHAKGVRVAGSEAERPLTARQTRPARTAGDRRRQRGPGPGTGRPQALRPVHADPDARRDRIAQRGRRRLDPAVRGRRPARPGQPSRDQGRPGRGHHRRPNDPSSQTATDAPPKAAKARKRRRSRPRRREAAKPEGAHRADGPEARPRSPTTDLLPGGPRRPTTPSPTSRRPPERPTLDPSDRPALSFPGADGVICGMTLRVAPT